MLLEFPEPMEIVSSHIREKSNIDYGFAGADIDRVNADWFKKILETGMAIVFIIDYTLMEKTNF